MPTTFAMAMTLAACGDDGVSPADGSSESGGTAVPMGSDDDFTTGLTTGEPTADTGPTTSLDSTTGDDGTTGTTDDGSDTGDPPDPIEPPGETFACDNEIAAAPAGQVCGVTPGSSTMLLQGTVLAGYDIYTDGTVLIDTAEPNGRILCTGCDCADAPEAAGATVVACPDGVISPGLINPHDHITFTLSQPVPHGTERYDHRHEWRLGLNGATELDTFPGANSSRSGVLYGELRNLIGGATSITGSVGGASAEDLLRNLDRADVTGGLSGVDVNYRTFPLGDSSGNLQSSGCGYPSIDGTFNLGDDIYLPHIAEGITAAAQNEFACLSGAPGGEDLIAANTSVIHGIGVRAQDVQRMGDVGAMLVWSPRSNIDLYGITADVPLYRNLGVRIALGTDWSASGSMNVLRELQCADALNQGHFDGALADVELFMMATHWAAASQGAADQLGLLTAGHIADITIFDGGGKAGHRAVIEGSPETVSLVLRGGQPLHGDAALIEALVPVAEVFGCETLDVCGVDKRICVERDAGTTIAAIEAAVSPDSYPFFFCGAPDNEPSCDPARPDEFPDRGGPDDADGDGVADDDDNCPNIFNPLRPMDDGLQTDTDQDGIGDSCDTCPLNPANDCDIPDVYDVDGDGVADPADNCVTDPNEDQADADDDGQGDACDACPDQPNPGGGACPVSLYDIKQDLIPDGQAVLVEGARVTGVGSNGYFIQMHPDDPGYDGPEFSGAFVFDNASFTRPAVGDLVDVTGEVSDFFGQLQIVADAAPTVISSGNAAPDPEPTTVADIVEGGPMQAELEGVVVELTNLVVTDVMPPPGPGDGAPTNEFEVAGGLRVNDYFYLVDPFPVIDQPYSRIVGVSRWANDYTKLEPRNIADYPATLIAFGSPQTYLLDGATAEPIPGLSAELSSVVAADTPVALTYGDEAIVTGPASVDVATGTSSVAVTLTAVAVGEASVTAELDGIQIATNVRVYDDAEARTPTLSPPTIAIPFNGTATMTVSLDLPAPLVTGQDVPLTLAPGLCAIAPASVNVPPEALEVQFDVDALACAGDEVVTATIGLASDNATVSVVDSPVFGSVVIVEAYYDHTAGDDQFEWVKLYNGTGAAVDLSGYALGWGGADYTYGTLDLVGTIDDGECFLVGGPMGNATSGFAGAPAFDQAADFNPDIQNSNAAGVADGVALFDVAAVAIGAGTVPIDALIYGTDNSSGLLDETGGIGVVDVADAPSENSVVLTDAGTWAINPAPSPEACTPFPSL